MDFQAAARKEVDLETNKLDKTIVTVKKHKAVTISNGKSRIINFLDLTKAELEKHLKRKVLQRQVLKQRFQQILGSNSKLPAQMGVDTTSQLVSQVNNFKFKPLAKPL